MSRLSDRNMLAGECVVATKGKTVVLVATCCKCCLHYALSLKHFSFALGFQLLVVARNLIPARYSGLDFSRWIFSSRCFGLRLTCFGVMPT